MKTAVHHLLIALTVGLPLAVLLLLAGCELSGQYNDDNVKVQFGNTNGVPQAQTQ